MMDRSPVFLKSWWKRWIMFRGLLPDWNFLLQKQWTTSKLDVMKLDVIINQFWKGCWVNTKTPVVQRLQKGCSFDLVPYVEECLSGVLPMSSLPHSLANVIDLIKFVGQEFKTSKEKLVWPSTYEHTTFLFWGHPVGCFRTPGSHLEPSAMGRLSGSKKLM